MSVFTLVIGLVSLLGFVLQVRDVFPKHREVRKALVFVVTGIFIGAIITTLVRTSLSETIHLNSITTLLFFCVLGLSAIALVALLKGDKLSLDRISFVILVAIVALALRSDGGDHLYSMDETLQLVDRSMERGDVDRAIILLQNAKKTLPHNDPRYASISQWIDQLKCEQVGVPRGK
jgi:hypothetical protein